LHELSLAAEIMDIVRKEVPGGCLLRRISLTVGGLSCVNPDSLVFCLESLVGDDVVIEVNRRPAELRCQDCGEEYTATDMYQPCICGSLRREVLSGRELTVDEIELKEPE
jgi:hydrogenase nickel insertion protein HypA